MERASISIRVRPLSEVELVEGSTWKLGSNFITLRDRFGLPISSQSYVFGKGLRLSHFSIVSCNYYLQKCLVIILIQEC